MTTTPKSLGQQPVNVIGPEGAFGNDYAGLTKRELFAAMVMQGLAENSGGPWQANAINGWSLTNCSLQDVAEVCADAADALLDELVKDQS